MTAELEGPRATITIGGRDKTRPEVDRVASILVRRLAERQVMVTKPSGRADVTVELGLEAGIGAEGFRIEAGDGRICITGNDPRGLLYGVGKFLRTSTFRADRWEPGGWRGTSVPEKPIRGAYFATHFHNFYHDAPLAEVERYLEDIALWGLNTLTVWFDMHHYRGIDEPAARAMINRLKSLLRVAKGLGLSTALVFISNEAYADSPEAMRAQGGGFGVELCPNKPGARDLMMKWVEERLEVFGDIAPDYLWIWPYDTGGCSCSHCAPWGANGFLSIAEPTARLYRKYFPQGKVILSTWFFDRFAQGEWAGLDAAFREKPDWVDLIMADNVGDAFPDYPLRHGVPGGFPMVSFPEISMVDSFWGGNGANPLPNRFQSLWDQSGAHLVGGFPYSEGIYEDINKSIIAQFQWQGERKAQDTLREYIAFEYSPDVVDEVVVAVGILEQNNQHALGERDGIDTMPMGHSTDADKAWAILNGVDMRLPGWARKSWRWRVLLLRAMIDAELAANEFRITDRCESAFQELVHIYHAQNAAFSVSPPTRDARRLKRPW